MPIKLSPHLVEKPWGRTDVPTVFGNVEGARIGEVWFEGPAGLKLPFLTKCIFTSEKLSIQVHPNDAQARQRGLARGKAECWYILAADPGSTLGLGLKRPVSQEQFRQSLADGSVEDLIYWRPVAPGEFYYVPPGTVHAIGAGITLIEFQQNQDVTYRLFDYGRPRELHLDDGVAVSLLSSYPDVCSRPAGKPLDVVLHSDVKFTVIRASTAANIPSKMKDQHRWVMPLAGSVTAQGKVASFGECLLLEPGEQLEFDLTTLALIGCATPQV